YVHPDDKEAVMEAAQAHIDGKTPEYFFEHRVLHKDGSVRWMLVRGKAIRDEQGTAVRLVGTDTDITSRKEAEVKLERQLNFERALAQAARTLLQLPENNEHRRAILDEALAYLVSAAQVDRAFIFQTFTDPELGECIGLIAEACAPGVYSHIENEINRRLPTSEIVPAFIIESMKAGKPVGGATADLWKELPEIRDHLLQQPLLSMQWFPIFIEGRWWGHVGFDDMYHMREWSDEEIVLLQAVADIFGSALQRWQTERILQQERDALETRVEERTAILERRLRIERVLASAAAHLMAREDFGTAIEQSLKEIGEVLGATEVLLVQVDVESRRVLAKYRWHPPGVEEWSFPTGAAADWFRRQMLMRSPLYITDVASYFEKGDVVGDALLSWNVRALTTYPLTVEDELVGIFNVSLQQPLAGDDATEVIEMLDIMANLLNGLLQRQVLIESRERQILAQTRQLSALLDAAVLDVEGSDLADVIRPILVMIADLSQSQTVAVYSLRSGNSYALVTDYRTSSTSLSWDATFQPDTALLDRLTTRKDPILLHTAEQLQAIPICKRDDDPGAGLIVSTKPQMNFQSLLVCYRAEEELYSPNQVALTVALADYMSTIAENFLLRRMAERTAIIEERQRLARDLHDSVSQSLYGVMLFARAGQDALESGAEEALAVDLNKVEEHALRALKEMRLLLYQLQPVALEQGGLALALQQRFEQVERSLDIETMIEIDPRISLSRQTEESLYRLASEALNNALKHAAATRVSVRLVKEADGVVLTIRDNGRGFDPEQKSTGMGLANMGFRAEKVGGVLTIKSAPGQGTVVRCVGVDIGD
ncbi:MAG TPA: PAS domain-containing protein, partial [Caldilineae bacterium]|nr:PAS domain-containing protein [Caldilineae bacterium]